MGQRMADGLTIAYVKNERQLENNIFQHHFIKYMPIAAK